MRKLPTTNSGLTTAFTLIELLVVIGIIGVLAAMIFPAANIIKANSAKKKARAELEMVALAIDRYKDKLGHYPPDNPRNPAFNTLFYELVGTARNTTGFATLDGAEQVTPAGLTAVFGQGGFINTRRDGGGDDVGAGHPCLEKLTRDKIGIVTTNGHRFALLTTSVAWPANLPPVISGGPPEMNPVRYVSSSPTNNSKSYDLWVDIPIGSRLWRISNWGEPHVVN